MKLEDTEMAGTMQEIADACEFENLWESFISSFPALDKEIAKDFAHTWYDEGRRRVLKVMQDTLERMNEEDEQDQSPAKNDLQ